MRLAWIPATLSRAGRVVIAALKVGPKVTASVAAIYVLMAGGRTCTPHPGRSAMLSPLRAGSGGQEGWRLGAIGTMVCACPSRLEREPADP
jgi:hypothetical protein